MSLVALVIRKTLKRALLDKTLAGARIYDSNIAPLDDLMVDNTAPTITVATDEQTGTFPALSYMNAERELTLVIEMAVAKAVRVEAEAEGEEDAEDVILPQTDEALEMTLDLMNRQIMFVMQAGPDPWSDLFRTFVGKPVKFASRRGAGWENGPRFAARQLIITYSPLHEPGFGKDPTRAWAALIAAMEADESLEHLAPVIGKSFKTAEVPTWAELQVLLGLTAAGAGALGVAPLLPGEEPALATILESDGDHLEVIAEPEPEPEEEED